jgi:hypothetical protein
MNQQINIEFDIFSNGVNTLLVADNSDWAYAETLPSYISVKTPGYADFITFSLRKNRVNVLNSHNLGISCFSGNCDEQYVELPDGIYTIKISSGYQNIDLEKFYLKTDRFELEFDKVAVKHGFEYSGNDILFQDKMLSVKWLLIVAKAHAKLGDFVKAQRFFDSAKKLLKSC